MEYQQIFKNVLGDPTSELALSDYINFVISHTVADTDGYTELHHILPQSLFEDYISCDDSIFKLEYKDHVEAHVLLSRAYPIRQFLLPLHFMLKANSMLHEEYRQSWSKCVKDWWAGFKQSDQYPIWVEKRREYARIQMNAGHAKCMSDKRMSSPGVRDEISQKMKAQWSDPEYKLRVKASMVAERNSDEGKARMKLAAKKNWDSRSLEKRDEFKQTMLVINSDEAKREDASEKMKDMWENDEEYKQKMKARKPRGHDGSATKALWANPEWRANILAKRKKK